MSVGPPQASKSPLPWMERPGEEGGRQSEWRLPRSSPSACFSPLTEVLGCATLCGHLLPDGSRAFSQCAPQVHQPAVNSWPRAVVVAYSLRHSPGAAEIRDESHCKRAAPSRGVGDGERECFCFNNWHFVALQRVFVWLSKSLLRVNRRLTKF